MKKQVMLLMMMILSGATSFGEGRQDKAVRETIDHLKSDQRKLTDSANNLAAELTQYKINAPSFTVATNKLALLIQDRAWRDIYSRETRTHHKASGQLRANIDEVKRLLVEARKPVQLIEDAEYDAWDKAHPEEARRRAIDQANADEEVNRKLVTSRGPNLSGLRIEKGFDGGTIVQEMPIVWGSDGNIDKVQTRKMTRMNARFGFASATMQEFENEKARNGGFLSDQQINEFANQHGIPVSR